MMFFIVFAFLFPVVYILSEFWDAHRSRIVVKEAIDLAHQAERQSAMITQVTKLEREEAEKKAALVDKIIESLLI